MIAHRMLVPASLTALALSLVPAPSNAGTIMAFPDSNDLKGQSELQSFAFRSAPPVAKQCLGQSGSGTITVTKPVDELSPQLAQASQAKKAALLHIDDTKADGTRVAYQLTNATVSKIAAAGGDKPIETITITYSKLQWITPGCKPPAQTARRGGVAPPGMQSSPMGSSAY